MRWSVANCDLAAGSYAIYVPFIVYFFLLLVFFSLPSIRPSAHPSAASLFRSVAFSFCGGKSSRADHVHLLGFSPASIELLFRTRSSHLLNFLPQFFSVSICAWLLVR